MAYLVRDVHDLKFVQYAIGELEICWKDGGGGSSGASCADRRATDLWLPTWCTSTSLRLAHHPACLLDSLDILYDSFGFHRP